MSNFYNSFRLNMYDYRNNNKYGVILKLKKASRYVFLLTFTIIYIMSVLTYTFNNEYLKATVVGSSMLPTFNNYDYQEPYSDEVFINSKAGSYEYGDIIVISINSQGQQPDLSEGTFVIKRLIAKGGDIITMNPDPDLEQDDIYNYYINGERLCEEYLFEPMDVTYYNDKFIPIADYVNGEGEHSFTVPEEEFFYLGDNRSNSEDSASSGETATREQIIGRVDLVLRKGDILLIKLIRLVPSMLGF